MLRFIVLAVTYAVVSAIFEDQIGEADWRIDNIGTIADAVYQDKRITVASEDGVLAQLLQNSGISTWRNVLPRGEQIDRMVIADGRIVSLCNKGSLLRAWGFDDGQLLWEASLVKISDDSMALRSKALDISFDTSTGLIVVLQDNCVNYIDLKTGEVKWFWCPSSDLLVISHLIFSSEKVPKKETSENTYHRTAIACQIKKPEGEVSDSSELQCEEPALLIASFPVGRGRNKAADYRMEMVSFAVNGFDDSEILVSEWRSAFSKSSFSSLSNAKSFDKQDLIFSAQVNNNHLYVSTLNLGEDHLSLNVVTKSDFGSKDLIVTSGVLQGYQPVVTVCDASPELSSTPGRGCTVFVIDYGVTNELVSCTASKDFTGGSAVVSLQRGPGHSWGDLRSVGCSQVEYPMLPADPLRVHSVLTKSSKSKERVESIVEIPRGEYGADLVRFLKSSYSQIFISKESGKEQLRSLVVGSGVGSLFLAQGSRVVWSREEALGHIKQVLMIPRPESTVTEIGSSSEGVVLSFSARLQMQYALLLKFWKQFSGSFSIQSRLFVLHLFNAESRRAAIYDFTNSLGFPLPFLAPNTAIAEKDTYLLSLEEKALRDSKDRTGVQFGFDKYVIALSHSGAGKNNPDGPILSTAAEFILNSATGSGPSGGSKIIALDLIHGEAAWTTGLNLSCLSKHVSARRVANGSPSSGDSVSLYMKLLPGATHRDEGLSAGLEGDPLAHGIGAAIVLASVRYSRALDASLEADDALTCFWHVDVRTGNIYNSDRSGSPSGCLPVGPGAVIGATLVDKSASGQLLHSAAEVNEILHSSEKIIGGKFTHLLLHHDDQSVSAYPSFDTTDSVNSVSQYVHQFNDVEGNMATYSVERNLRTEYSDACPTSLPSNLCSRHVTYGLKCVGIALTHSTPRDRVLTVAYPTPYDKTTSRAYVLGDKSLLLKYLNPNIAVVVSESLSPISHDNTSSSSLTGDQLESHLVVTVMDTVTARVIFRYDIAHGASTEESKNLASSVPVRAEIIEHAVVVTYWNHKAQRMELSSVMLYEGMIPKNGLGPVTSYQSPPYIDVSSFTADQPIGLQKTFVLPKAVEYLSHTLTLKGLTNKHLLVGLRNGQVYRLDMRHIDPRRPLTAPTQAEKDEGLMQYNPFLQLPPQSAATINGTISRLTGISCSPTMALESISLVFAFGLDLFFTRVSPSKGFDMLSSEFNRPLLTLILSVMLVIVLILRKMNRNKVINKAWK